MKKGFTCGTFDLCHAGHFLMFKECKENCDYLIVALQSDPTLDRPNKNKPVLTVKERATILEGVKYIDELRFYNTETELLELLKEIKPEIRFVGEDHKSKSFTGDTLSSKIFWNKRYGYSSSDLRRRVYEAELLKLQNSIV